MALKSSLICLGILAISAVSLVWQLAARFGTEATGIPFGGLILHSLAALGLAYSAYQVPGRAAHSFACRRSSVHLYIDREPVTWAEPSTLPIWFHRDRLAFTDCCCAYLSTPIYQQPMQETGFLLLAICGTSSSCRPHAANNSDRVCAGLYPARICNTCRSRGDGRLWRDPAVASAYGKFTFPKFFDSADQDAGNHGS